MGNYPGFVFNRIFMIDFIGSHLFSFIAIVLVTSYLVGFYLKYFKKQQVRDDWFEASMMGIVMYKNKKNHPELVGSLVRQNRNTSYVVYNDGKLERRYL